MTSTAASPQPQTPAGASHPGTRFGPWLLIALLVLSLVGFAVTRAVRVQDDIVNTVVLSETIEPGETATVEFTTTVDDSRADVLITDTEDRQVRSLALGTALAAGPQRFSWDGTGDDGEPVAPGRYGLRVILGEQGRDIKPPGRIEVLGPSGGG